MEPHIEWFAPEVSAQQRAMTDLIKRIRKLRWIGMDEEAELVEVELASYGDVPTDSVLAVPNETD